MKGLDDSEDSLNVYENISINSDMNFDSEQWKEIEQNEIKAKTTPKIRITEQMKHIVYFYQIIISYSQLKNIIQIKTLQSTNVQIVDILTKKVY